MRVLVLVALIGCVEPSVIECSDGRVCPSGTNCDNANHQCVTDEQLATCVGAADGDDCMVGDDTAGICSMQVCIAARCGDGFVKGSERCDGTNLDGRTLCADLGYYNDAAIACRSDCTYDESMCHDRCGDDIVNGPEFCEPSQPQSAVSCIDFGFDQGLVGCSGACQPDFETCERFGFAPVVTGVTGYFRGVWGTGPNDVFIFGDFRFAHWDGDKWSEQDPGSMALFNDGWGSGPNDVWAVGENGTVSHYQNGTWSASSVPSGATTSLTGIWGTAASNVYACGTGGKIYRYNGTAWSEETSNTGADFNEIWGTGANEVYAVGLDSLDARTSGGWTETVLSGNYEGVGGLGATDAWVAGASNSTGSHIYHQTGSPFTEVAPITWATSIHALWELSPTEVFFATQQDVAVGDGNKYIRLHSSPLVDFWGSGPKDIWATTAFGGVRHFTGTAWVDDGNFTTPMDRVHGTAADNVYASNGSNVLEWDGDGWTALTAPPGVSLGLWAAAKDDLFEISTNGAINRWNGSIWTPETSNTNVILQGIWGRNVNDIWVVGEDATVVHRTAGGWTPTTIGNGTDNLTAVYGFGANDVYAAGFNSTGGVYSAVMYHYTGTWAPVTIPDAPFIYDMWGSGPNDVYASTVGKLLHYNGSTWSVVDFGVQIPIFGVGGSSATDVFAVGSLGRIYHYDGTAWSPLRSPTELVVFRVWALPKRVVFASDGGTFMMMRTYAP